MLYILSNLLFRKVQGYQFHFFSLRPLTLITSSFCHLSTFYTFGHVRSEFALGIAGTSYEEASWLSLLFYFEFSAVALRTSHELSVSQLVLRLLRSVKLSLLRYLLDILPHYIFILLTELPLLLLLEPLVFVSLVFWVLGALVLHLRLGRRISGIARVVWREEVLHPFCRAFYLLKYLKHFLKTLLSNLLFCFPSILNQFHFLFHFSS